MQESDFGSHREIDLQERMEKIAPVLKTIPPGTQVAVIDEGDELQLYNITKAFEILAGRPATAVINVAEQAKRIQPRDAGLPSDYEALIDPAHAETVDLSYPVMLLGNRNELDASHGRVIDGWHRIYRAAQLGIAELPAVVITAEDEAVIRIEPGEAQLEKA